MVLENRLGNNHGQASSEVGLGGLPSIVFMWGHYLEHPRRRCLTLGAEGFRLEVVLKKINPGTCIAAFVYHDMTFHDTVVKKTDKKLQPHRPPFIYYSSECRAYFTDFTTINDMPCRPTLLLFCWFTTQTGWGVTLPWLSYVEEASDVRDGTDIEMQLTFASEMRVVLAKYALDGTWLGMEEMSTQVRGCRRSDTLVYCLL